MSTILLNPQSWDLMIDAFGNIAKADTPYAMAQDVASACKLFKGELWYNTDKGIPYFQSILGYRPPLGLLKNEYQNAAMSVVGAQQASASFNKIGSDRVLSGQLKFIDQTGKEAGIKL